MTSGRSTDPPVGQYAYHYAACAAAASQYVSAALPDVRQSWDPGTGVLRLGNGPGAAPLYYCDDGWRFYYGTDAGAVMKSVSANRPHLQILDTGRVIEVTPIGVSAPHETICSAPLRILALVTDGYGAHGGIARYNRDFFEALTAAGSVGQVFVLPRNGQIFSRPGLEQARPIFTRGWYVLRALAGLFRFRPGLIFCGHLYMAPLAALLARLLRVPYWLQVHGVEVFEPPNPLVRWAVRRATLITAVSRYTRNRLLHWAQIEPERVRVLPNTVDERYRPGDRESLKREAGYAGCKLLLTVSRLDSREQYKGHDRVLAVLPELLKQHPQLIYLIAGDGSDRERLESLTKAAGLSDRVRFLGRINDGELLRLYQMSDVFVMPSTGEGFGIVFLEAAACGCAVVGGNADGSVDALGEGAIGAMTNPDDPVALMRAMTVALEQTSADGRCVLRFHRSGFEKHLRRLLSSILNSR